MEKRELKFVKMTTTITTYGLGKTLEEAKIDARSETIDYAYNISISPNDYLRDAQYQEVKQEDTNFDDVVIEMFDDIGLGLDDGE